MNADASGRPALEVAEVIREHGDTFRAKYAAVLTTEQQRALHDLAVDRKSVV